MLALEFIKHEVLRRRRSDLFRLKAAEASLITLFVIAPAVVVLFAIAYLGSRHLNSTSEGVEMVYGALTYVLIAFAAFSPLHRPSLDRMVKPYLILPFRKTTVGHILQISTAVTVPAACVGVMILGVWFGSVVTSMSASDAFCWLATLGLLLFGAHLVSNMLRTVLWRSLTGYLGIVLGVIALLAVDLVGGTHVVVTSSTWLLSMSALAGPYALGITVAIVGSLYVAALRRTLTALYVDGQIRPWTSARTSSVRIPASGSGDVLLDVCRLQTRLIFRNTRTRFFALNIFTFSLLGVTQFFLGFRESSVFMLSVGIVVLVCATGMSYTVHSLRLNSSFFDGLSVWPLEPRTILRSVIRVSQAATVAAFLPVCVIMVLLEPQSVYLAAGLALYSIGTAVYAFTYVGAYERRSYDLSLGAFDVKGATATYPLANLACGLAVGLPPLALLLWSSTPFKPGIALPLALAGLLGLAFEGYWLSHIARVLRARKYVALEGFRQ